VNLLNRLVPRVQAANKRIVLPRAMIPASSPPPSRPGATASPRPSCSPRRRTRQGEKDAGVTLASAGIECLDFTTAAIAPKLAEAFFERRKSKGMTPDNAAKTIRTQRLFFGNMMLNLGMVDGLVAGSLASTPDMLRAAFQCVGTAKGIALGSSCFVMDLRTPTPSGDETLLYADCGVNPCRPPSNSWTSPTPPRFPAARCSTRSPSSPS